MRASPVGTAMALLLSACSSVTSPTGGDRGAGPMGPRPGLFVSPFGELFLGEPGQAWPTAIWFAGADLDEDARVTFDEFTADGQRYFAELDLNTDGRIEPQETAAYELGLAEARGRMPGMFPPGMPSRGRPPAGFPGGFPPRGPGGSALDADAPQQMPGGGGMPGGGPGGGPGGRLPPSGMPRMRAPTGPLAYGPIAAAGFFNYPQPIKAADLDMNQTITGTEWAQATDRWFVSLDTDRDGVLLLETLPKTPLQTLFQHDD